MNEQLEQSVTEDVKNKKKSESKAIAPKISLPDSINSKVAEILQTLKDREADVKLEDLFQELFDKADDRYWKRQVEKFTPHMFIFEQAQNDPELLQTLLKKAKRGLEKKARGHSGTSKKRTAVATKDGAV